jgi:hypothetical protein
LSFKTVVKLVNVDTLIFQDASFEAVREIISSFWQTTLAHIGQGTIIDQQRRLSDPEMMPPSLQTEENERRMLTTAPYNSTFILSYPVWFALKDYGQFNGNATQLFNYLTELLDGYVYGGEFQQALRNAALSMNITQLYQVIVPVVHYYDYYVWEETASPTQYPTSFPSSVPTSVPTSMPSSMPSSIPSSQPTNVPKVIPLNSHVLFSAFFGINNVAGSALTPEGQQALLETIIDITDVPTEQLTFNGITNETPGLRRRLTTKWDMVVEVKFDVPVSQFPQFTGNVEALLGYLKLLLTTSVKDLTVQSGAKYISVFSNHLHQHALTISGYGGLFDAEVVKVDFSNWIVEQQTHNPTSRPTSHPTGKAIPPPPPGPDAVIFQAYFGLGQATSPTLSPEGQTTLLQTIGDILDISVAQVDFVDVVDTTRRRRLDESSGTHSLIVETKILLFVSEYPEFAGDTTKLVDYAMSLLETSVSDNTFGNLLKSNAIKNGATDIINVVVFQLQFGAFHPLIHTPMPTVMPTSGPTVSQTATPTISLTAAPTIALTATPTASPTNSINEVKDVPPTDSDSDSKKKKKKLFLNEPAMAGVIAAFVFTVCVAIFVIYFAVTRCYRPKEAVSVNGSEIDVESPHGSVPRQSGELAPGVVENNQTTMGMENIYNALNRDGEEISPEDMVILSFEEEEMMGRPMSWRFSQAFPRDHLRPMSWRNSHWRNSQAFSSDIIPYEDEMTFEARI